MKKTGIFLLAMTLFSGVYAQTSLNSIGLPSPNNSFLGNVASSTGVGVDLYTGTAQVNVPLCNLTSRSLSIPVSLIYTAGAGVKVQDYATNVGLGWQLNAGGSISRVVRGFPDEFPNGYLGTSQTGQKIENYFNGVPGATFPAGVDNGLNLPTHDGEPDIYFVRTPSFSFQFSFDGNGNPVFNNETGIKITANSFINTSNYMNSTFTVTDAGGNVYSFGAYTEKTITTLYGTSYTFNSAWYLSTITAFNSADVVTFNYQTSQNNDVLNHYQWVRSYVYGCQDNTGSDPIPITIVQPQYISNIICSNGAVEFTYAFDRRDITTAARLSGIVWRSTGAMGNTTLQSFGFNYSYFNDPTTDVNLLRLRLDNITIAGGTTATATPMTYRTFTYNPSNPLPARNSQLFDYWGYYKSFIPFANPDPMYDPTLRTPSESHTKAAILTSIQELTGATWNFTYELNTFYKTSGGTNANVAVGGLRVKTLSKTLTTGENLQTTYEYNDDLGKSTGKVITEAYNALVLNVIDPNGCILRAQKVFSETPINIYDINGVFVGYSAVKAIQQNGGYTVSEYSNFNDFPDVYSTTNICNDINVPSFTSSISFGYKRGLLKKQTVYNAANAKISEDEYSFTSLTNPVTKKSWAFRWFVASGYCSGNGGSRTLSATYYSNVENYRLTSAIHRDYDQLNQASFVQSAVNYTYCPDNRSIRTLTSTDSKGNTSTKTFYHTHDTGIPMVTGPEQTAISGMQTLNNLNALVHEIDNKNGAITQMHNIYSTGVGGTGAPYLTGSAAYKGSALLHTQNFLYETERSNLVSVSNTGGQKTGFIYGYNNSYPVAKITNAGSFYTTQQSTGGIGNTFTNSYSTSFTVDYTGTIGWTVYGMGISGSATVSYTLHGPSPKSGSQCIGSGGCSSYYSVSHANMPPGSYSVVITVSGSYSGSGFYMTGSYPKHIQVLTKEFYYEGFEEHYAGVSGSAHTGNRYLDATQSAFSINFTLPNSRNYVMQWWNWVNGKWAYNETPYTGPRTLSGIIDDIRIFPEDAQMESYTYDPLVGKTGQTDPAGRSTTYEYDGLQRINIVRDNDKNIISKNCYNYIGQPVNCPVASVYSNTAKSGTFTRNNCGAGFIGSSVTYNVAAGTYTSSISQADAEQKAVNDVNTNGQNYANANGTCYQLYYNVQTSGTFTRNNCGSGSTGSSVTYTVPAGTYSSTVSQADANQLAQNDVNANGQNYANANGTCTGVSCSFSMTSGYGTPTNNISSSGGSVSFYIVWYSTSSPMTVGNSYFFTTINGSCRPSVTRILNLTSGSNSWQVTIQPNGMVIAKLMSGSTVNPGSTTYFSSSFNL